MVLSITMKKQILVKSNIPISRLKELVRGTGSLVLNRQDQQKRSLNCLGRKTEICFKQFIKKQFETDQQKSLFQNSRGPFRLFYLARFLGFLPFHFNEQTVFGWVNAWLLYLCQDYLLRDNRYQCVTFDNHDLSTDVNRISLAIFMDRKKLSFAIVISE